MLQAEDERGVAVARWERVYQDRGSVVLADGRRFDAHLRVAFGWRRSPTRCWQLLHPHGKALLTLACLDFATLIAGDSWEIRLGVGASDEPELGLLCLLLLGGGIVWMRNQF
jgi:hypothetical protein